VLPSCTWWQQNATECGTPTAAAAGCCTFR
jgi:hypothetical protein